MGKKGNDGSLVVYSWEKPWEFVIFFATLKTIEFCDIHLRQMCMRIRLPKTTKDNVSDCSVEYICCGSYTNTTRLLNGRPLCFRKEVPRKMIEVGKRSSFQGSR